MRIVDYSLHGAALLLAVLTVWLAGQPLYANDTWIHLALGRAFAAGGPWLDVDPYLFAAPGPPDPSSWLGAITLFEIQSLLGLHALRVFHATIVAVTLALAWQVGLRATGSRRAASIGLVFFIVLASYRLVQLRPDLFSIVAVLLLYLVFIAPREGPSGRAIIGAGLLGLVWANVHAAFLLGPILLLGVAASLFLLDRVTGFGAGAGETARARGLALAGGAMLVASFLNPTGPAAHMAYFTAGDDTLALAAVIDEWGPTNLLAWPSSTLPPTPAAWAVAWLAVLGVCTAALALFFGRGQSEEAAETRIDPALLALAVAGAIAAIVANRFLWLVLFGVLVGLVVLGSRLASRPSGRLAGLVVVLLFTALHLTIGDWPNISRSLRSVEGDYRKPYYTEKFFGHAMRFLSESGLEGRIYNDYPLGGFMSFWLSPNLSMASSGTMNVEREAMETNLSIGARMPGRPGEAFADTLDRQGFDLFLGVGLSVPARPGRPIPSTVRHLEHLPGWVPVFRSLRSAVHLRRDEANAENRARVAAYYAREGVPYDPDRGFEPARVIESAPEWATRFGLIPTDFAELVERVEAGTGRELTPELDGDMRRLALIYASLGLYEESTAIDRALLLRNLADADATRRAIWSTIQLRRLDRARGIAQTAGANDWLSAIEIAEAAPGEERETWIAQLPLMQIFQVPAVRLGTLAPEPLGIRRTD